LTPSVWRIAALPKIVEEIVSGVLVVFENWFHFMRALLMEAVSMIKHLFTGNNSVIMRSITHLMAKVRPFLKIAFLGGKEGRPASRSPEVFHSW
jgi:hypothetical protein